jgi:choline dehydrogenase-like flavoprotein
MSETAYDYDVLVIGSGFGGSVSALRLTEKGYRVGVLEAGARFEDEDLPATSWDTRKFLFAPALGMYGIQRINVLKDCLILSGAGVGGGSLVYANTLYEPLEAFYRDPSWSHITDWRTELAPYYDQAKRMLGVVENPLRTPADKVMKQVADEMGVSETFHPTPVGVFFGGRAGERVPDPYFGGAGPVDIVEPVVVVVGDAHAGSPATPRQPHGERDVGKPRAIVAEEPDHRVATTAQALEGGARRDEHIEVAVPVVVEEPDSVAGRVHQVVLGGRACGGRQREAERGGHVGETNRHLRRARSRRDHTE